MSVWTFSLMAVVTLIWVGMVGAVAHLAAQKVSARNLGQRDAVD